MRMRLLCSRKNGGLASSIALLLLFVLAVPSTVTAFLVVPQQNNPMKNLMLKNTIATTSNRRSLVVQALASKSQQNNNNNAANGNRPKNRRFSQQAHIDTLKNGKNKKAQGNRSGKSASKASSRDEEVAVPRQQQQPRSPQGQERGDDKNKNNQKNKDYMWRSGKSIDELESIMMKRWGDEISQWTADPDEVEAESSADKGKRQNDKKSPKFNAKPVMDPWDNSEKQRKMRSDGGDDEKDDETRGRGSFGGAQNSIDLDNDGDDPMLSRVRRNQARLQEKRGRGESSDSYEQTNNNNDFEPVAGATKDFFGGDNDEDESTVEQSFDFEREFYDEDDEGYEPTSGRYDDDEDDNDLFDAVDKLIGPQPGATVSERKPRKSQSYNNAAVSPGFFFREAAANEYDASMEEKKAEEEQEESKKSAAKRNKRNKSRSRAVLDEDGNPMFLTVEQAERNFEASLVATQIAAAGEDNNEDGVVTEYIPPETRSWEELGITSDELLDNLQRMGCGAPLSVQDKACPPILSGNDALIGTYTGSGKTLAFLAPLAQRLLFMSDTSKSGGDIQILIVAPGRELASQIVSVARSLLEGTGLTCMLAIGGTTFSRNLEQVRKKKPTILVGTPGRVAELVVGRPGEKSGRLKIGNIQSLVMDEFDALLEYKPHRDPTKAILQTLKRRHGDALQSVLCSATASDMIQSPKLLSFLRQGFAQVNADEDDQLVTSLSTTTASKEEEQKQQQQQQQQPTTRVSRTVIHGSVHLRHRRLALDTLRRILHTEPLPQQALIFADSSRRVEIIVDKLSEMGIVAAPLHGGRGSEKMDRSEVSKALREGYVGLVVATEMAARGLDAPLLTHVINLDLPTDASHYAHRAGRCGRGGRPGVVINFTTDAKERNVPKRFASELGITMHNVEAQGGKLCIVDEEEQSNDENSN